MKITVKMLENKMACTEQILLFKKYFGNSVVLSYSLIDKYYNQFDLDWFVIRFFNIEQKIQYDKAITLLQEQYDKANAPLWEQYDKAIALLWEQYKKADTLLWEQYKKADTLLWEQYKKANAPLWEQYEKARAKLFIQTALRETT